MALKTYKRTTPSVRQLAIVDRSELYKAKPLKALTVGKSEKGGRNNSGRTTVRFRGGGHKQSYRIVDFKRRKFGVAGMAVDVKAGNAMALANIPVGTIVHNVELKIGKGGALARSAGGYAQIVARDQGYVSIRLN